MTVVPRLHTVEELVLGRSFQVLDVVGELRSGKSQFTNLEEVRREETHSRLELLGLCRLPLMLNSTTEQLWQLLLGNIDGGEKTKCGEPKLRLTSEDVLARL